MMSGIRGGQFDVFDLDMSSNQLLCFPLILQHNMHSSFYFFTLEVVHHHHRPTQFGRPTWFR
jgi:hypothetical protein